MKAKNGYNEGSWMNKYNGKYYLQYASPGTEFKTYADGVYTSDSPNGPFKYETYSPFSYKPGGVVLQRLDDSLLSRIPRELLACFKHEYQYPSYV